MKRTSLRLRGRLAAIILLFAFTLTGCADMVEIQERDFVMAMGIAWQEEYQFTFALPDLDAVTGQSSGSDQDRLVRTIHGATFPEIEETYNRTSKNRLDLRHLQAIVFDASVCTNPAKMKEILEAMNDHYELSHNVLVFYCLGNTKDLVGMEGNLDSSIGDYLRKINKNNQRDGVDKVTIGQLITAQENNTTIAIPVIDQSEASVFLDGSVLFQNNQTVRYLNQPESALYHLMKGEGNGYLFQLSGNTVIKVTAVRDKLLYENRTDGPYIKLTLSGTGQVMPKSHGDSPSLAGEFNQLLASQIQEAMMPILLEQHLDFLNLYEKSSYRQRDVWMRYQGETGKFTDELTLEIVVDFTLES